MSTRTKPRARSPRALHARGAYAVLVIGGTRSGKSRFAEQLALSLSSEPVYLATSRRVDDDHARRIERHRRDRGTEWTTLEEDLHLGRVDATNRVVVVDCVTLWLSNWFADLNGDADAALAAATLELSAALETPATWIFVSNELGQGVHAPTEVGRRFADLSGFMNQRIAERARLVVNMVAGIAVPVKGALPRRGSLPASRAT